MDSFPAFIKLYDILYLNNEDLRDKTWKIRRSELEKWHKKNKNIFFDLSKVIKFNDWNELSNIKQTKIKSLLPGIAEEDSLWWYGQLQKAEKLQEKSIYF